MLYSLQHHGGKTRLLDWSESFSTALYFALANWQGENSAVWMLDPVELNYVAIGKKTITAPMLTYPDSYLSNDPIPSIAVYPIKNTQRICAQHGVFTIQGNCLKPLNEEFAGSLVKAGHLKALNLTRDIRLDAMRFLKQNNINHFSLFPDLDGLAIYLNNILTNQSCRQNC